MRNRNAGIGKTVGLAAACMAALCAGAVLAGQVVFEVREPLGCKAPQWSVAWSYYHDRELLSYPFTAPQGACHRASARLMGPGGEVPVQISDVQTWGDTPFVQHATVYFLVPRPESFGQGTYTLSYGAKPREAPASDADPFVKVLEQGEQAVFVSSRWTAKTYLNIGEKTYEEPIASADVPGPFAGMSLGEAMTQPEGGSRLTGDVRVKSWSGRVTDRGPVFARAAFQYVFANGNTLTLTARMVSGDAYTRWEMDSSQDCPQQGIEFRMMRMVGVTEAGLAKGYGQWARDRKVPVKDSNEPFVYLSPDTSIANAFPESPWRIQMVRKLGEDRADINFISHDPGAWAEPAKPQTYAGFRTFDVEMIPKMWEHWQRKRIAVSYEDETPVLRMNLARGQRKWSVGHGGLKTGEGLDRLKGMVLEWPAANEPRPSLFVDRQRIESLWKSIGDNPATLRACGLLPGDALSTTTLRNRQARMACAVWCTRMMTSDDPTTASAARRGLGNVKTQDKMEDMSQFKFDGTPPRTPREEFFHKMYFENARTAPVKHLVDYLALLGNFDVMRHAITVAALYDALIDSDLITPEQRRAIRAQTAYLAYLMTDPQCWDAERGYASGNPNMSVSYTCSLGILACTLRDHPMAPKWADNATRWVDKWLTDEVGPNGTWIPEGAHYGNVSLEPILAYAVAAKRAGLHDFSNDPRLKRLMLYWAQHQTPPDPRRSDKRVSDLYGRGPGGESQYVFGVAARLFADSDPNLSRIMQWVWAQTGYPVDGADFRMGGYDAYYMDRSLPMSAPQWASENFPKLGAVLRHGFNTANESYLNILSNVQSHENLDVWVPGVGGIAQWFARGKPLSTSFSFKHGMQERHDLLRDGVRLTHPWASADQAKSPFGYYTQTRSEAFASLGAVDYVRSTFTVTGPDTRDWFPPDLPAYPPEPQATQAKLDWTRQMLFLRNADPAGPAYLVLRDSVKGGQPTTWQFWTLSEKLGTAAEANSAEAFLADKPGQKILPARELARSDRYTALGQFGMDLDFFIASPADSPRQTLRYGGVVDRRPEYQDLLHLQLPGDGAYYVALFPRPRDEMAPAFTALDGGKIIKVAGGFGTDYALLAPTAISAAVEGVTLSGTAAAAQTRPDGSARLTVSADGEARWKDFGVKTASAAELAIAADGQLTLTTPPDSEGGVVTVRAPRGYRMQGKPKEVKVTEKQGEYEIAVPPGANAIGLRK